MHAGINNVVYMELHSGPKTANGTCGKMIVVGTIDRGSTVFPNLNALSENNHEDDFSGSDDDFLGFYDE